MGTATVETTTAKRGGNMGTVTIDAVAVGDMVGNALGFSAQRTRLRNGEQARKAILDGDCSVCDYLKYSLSKQIGEYLGDLDASVHAVYTYEPEYSTGVTHLDGTAPPLERGLNLLVSVDRRSAALTSIVASLEDALREAAKPLICSKGNGSCYVLDVKVADEEEVARRRGYGALISSSHVKPLRVWSREA